MLLRLDNITQLFTFYMEKLLGFFSAELKNYANYTKHKCPRVRQLLYFMLCIETTGTVAVKRIMYKKYIHDIMNSEVYTFEDNFTLLL